MGKIEAEEKHPIDRLGEATVATFQALIERMNNAERRLAVLESRPKFHGYGGDCDGDTERNDMLS